MAATTGPPGKAKTTLRQKAAVAGSIAQPELAPVLAGAAAKGPKPKAPAGGKPVSAGNRILLAEFLACFVVLGLGTIVAPQGSKDGVPRLMSRGSGLCLLFFVLALVAGAGSGARRVANGLGGLVTVAYLVTSSDAHNIFSWIGAFYSTAGVKAGQGIGDLGGAVTAAQNAGSAAGNLAGAAE